MEVGRFSGWGLVLNLAGHNRPLIDRQDLEPWDGRIGGVDFVLFHTGWSRLWGTDAYFRDYPVLSEAAARWISGFNLKGIGFDLISPDPMGSTDLPVHRILLGKDRIIVENLTNLDLLPPDPFWFCCLPLQVAGADGFPVRAVAVI
jgi:kynurenine formamidase